MINEGLILETLALEIVYSGHFILLTQLINQIILLDTLPTQHHSFFMKLSPLDWIEVWFMNDL